MRRLMFDLVSGVSNGVDRIIRNSSRAVCGAFEREVVVKSSEVSSTKSKLRRAGYVIIGTGPAGFGRTKIWFNPAGVSL